MGNTKELSVVEILEKRLQELKKFLEEKGNSATEISPEKTETDTRIQKYEERGYTGNLGTEQLELRDILEGYRKSGEINELIAFDEEIRKDSNQYSSETHGAAHTRRVAFFARTLANLGNLDDRDKKILLFAAKNHDIGRVHDWEDAEHGKNSASKLNGAKGWDEFSADEQELIAFVITEHSKGKDDNIQAISGLSPDKQAKYKTILEYLKDADKLDRVRLGRFDGLDPSRLSMPISKKMVKMAYQSYEFLFDSFDYERKTSKTERMLQDIDSALILVEQVKTHPTIETVETEPLRYFDDEPDKEISPSDELLKKTVERSKVRCGLWGIKSLALHIKAKLMEKINAKKKGMKEGDGLTHNDE